MTHHLYKIQGQVQAYQWGGKDFLPNLLGYQNTAADPQAEYWLGAHPSACATTAQNSVPIDALLRERHSPPLQFLLKILDVQDMLSIQAHPNKQQAQDGFARENALGIAPEAKNRNYKDDSDKPELMVALSEFWLLHGFRRDDEIIALLAQHPCLAELQKNVRQNGLKEAFAFALNFASADVQTMQQSLTTSLAQVHTPFAKNTVEFWIQRWLQKNPGVQNGILTLFFLNLLKLEPGQAIYQPAGLLHAYLEGQNVELMANSDNVLRAGLTPKHIDVAELLRTCTIKPSRAEDFLIAPKNLASGETQFVTPFEAFELSEINAESGASVFWEVTTPEILFCYHGSATLNSNTGSAATLRQGESFLLLPQQTATLTITSTTARFFKARNL